MQSLLHLFHEQSPYEGHDIAAHPADLQGWGSHDPAFAEVLKHLRPSIIVEVGTWKGRSAIYMANLAKKFGFSTQIVCIDTWLGSWEHIISKNPEWRSWLRRQNGYPRLYFTFLTNVVTSGLSDVITPIPVTSDNGARILARMKIKADLIYIDGEHDYEAVLRDLRAYWPLVSDGGVLLGDDYNPGGPVEKAAVEFAAGIGRPIAQHGRKFIIPKQGEPADYAPSLRTAA